MRILWRVAPLLGLVLTLSAGAEAREAIQFASPYSPGTIIISQRKLIRLFLVPGLIVLPIVFLVLVYKGQTALSLGMFALGLFTVAQFSFWGNYLPRVYPLHLRGTGESFAANVGGRMIGTSFAAITATLAGEHYFGDDSALNFAMVAAGVALTVYVIGFLLSRKSISVIESCFSSSFLSANFSIVCFVALLTRSCNDCFDCCAEIETTRSKDSTKLLTSFLIDMCLV